MIRRFWEGLTDKRQLSMRDRQSDDIHWKLNISPLALWSSLLALIVIIFGVLLLLMAYTSILDILPGYRTRSERLHDNLTESIIRLDSMERHMNMILEYNEAVSAILGGSSPALQSTILTDTIRYDKSRIMPTRADSLLRAALESTSGEYSLANTKPLKGEAAMFNAPLRGHIVRSFDAPESSYDIAIVALDSEGSVMAIENGTVIAVESHSDGNASVTIHHAGGYISVYKNLSEVLVRKGQAVQSGSVIGRIAEDNESNESSHVLGFELWRDGMAVDPELYILF